MLKWNSSLFLFIKVINQNNKSLKLKRDIEKSGYRKKNKSKLNKTNEQKKKK